MRRFFLHLIGMMAVLACCSTLIGAASSKVETFFGQTQPMGRPCVAKVQQALTSPAVSIVHEGDLGTFDGKHVQLLGQGAIEAEESRNLYGCYYTMADGRQAALISMAPRFFVDTDGKYQLIDNHIVASGAQNSRAYTNAAHAFSVDFPNTESTQTDVQITTPVGMTLTVGANAHLIYCSNTGSCRVLQEAADAIGQVNENCVSYPDRYENIDQVYSVTSRGLKLDWIVNSRPLFIAGLADGMVGFAETVILPDGLMLTVNGQALTDAYYGNGALEIREGNNTLVATLAQAVAFEGYPETFDPEQDAQIPLAYHIEPVGMGQFRFAVCVPVVWLNDSRRVYPLTVDPTIHFSTNQSADDCYQWGAGELSYTSEYLRVGYRFDYGFPYYLAFLRWQGVSIPAGSTIDYASVNWRAYSDGDTPCSFLWQFEASDNAQSCTNTYPIGRTYVSNSNYAGNYTTNWTAGRWYGVGDVSAGLQEVINRPGWVAGNSIGMKWAPYAAAGNFRTIYSYDHMAGDSAPYLYVEYIPGSVTHCYFCPDYDYSIVPTETIQTHADAIQAGECRWYRIEMTAGETYLFTSCQNGGSYTNDTLFTLFNPSCLQVAINDDTCGLGSEIIYTAVVDGSHYLQVKNYDDEAEAYTLAYRSGLVVNVPDLLPYQPSGWDDVVVISAEQGTQTSAATVLTTDDLYVDWAVGNGGTADTELAFEVAMYFDDDLVAVWTIDALAPDWYGSGEDYHLGPLNAGWHSVRIQADRGNIVTESDEGNNSYTRMFKVITPSPADIRISPTAINFDCLGTGGMQGQNDGIPAESIEIEEPVANVWTEHSQWPIVDTVEKMRLPEMVLEQLDEEGRAHVIVTLSQPVSLMAQTNYASAPDVAALRAEVALLDAQVLTTLDDEEFQVEYVFENQAGFSGYADTAALDKLLDHPAVAAIEPVRMLEAHLAQGVAMINALASRSTYGGQNLAIAICDTGVDYTHPRLGNGGFPNNKVLGGYDFGSNDANPIAVGNAHGTCCAGIAAGDLGTFEDYIGGVAPDAKLYALKISPDRMGYASSASMIAAWDWCVTHQYDNPDYPIMVISTSFGGGYYDTVTDCDLSEPAMTTAALNANAAGITVLASAGNDGFCDGLSWPACISHVISVGALFDADIGNPIWCVAEQSCVGVEFGLCGSSYACVTGSSGPGNVICYSNTASFLDVLAPSNSAYTTDIVGEEGYSDSDYCAIFGGTSAACPYAAGAVAALQSAARIATGRYLSPDQIRGILTSTGHMITDEKVAITKPRIDLAAAIDTLSTTFGFTIYNDGAADLEVTDMTWPDWVSITPEPPFTVGGGQGRQVIMQFDCMNVCAVKQDVVAQLTVLSNDIDESPYPNGISIQVNCVDCLTAPEGDLNDDCRTEWLDMAELAEQWLQCDPICSDLTTFTHLADHWLDCGLLPSSACW